MLYKILLAVVCTEGGEEEEGGDRGPGGTRADVGERVRAGSGICTGFSAARDAALALRRRLDEEHSPFLCERLGAELDGLIERALQTRRQSTKSRSDRYSNSWQRWRENMSGTMNGGIYDLPFMADAMLMLSYDADADADVALMLRYAMLCYADADANAGAMLMLMLMLC
eukprot:g48188.t1